MMRRKRTISALATLSACLLLLSGCVGENGDDGDDQLDVQETSAATFDKSTSSLEFGPGQISGEITFSNIGDPGTTLTIDDVELSADTDDAFMEGANWPDDTLVLDGGESHSFTVLYAGDEPAEHTGAVTATTTDSTNPSPEVQLLSPEHHLELEATPSPLDFGEVPVNLEPAEELELINTGGETIEIDDIILIDGTQFYSFDVDGNWEPGDTDPKTLDPGESLDLTVYFAPVDDGVESGELVVEASQPFEATRSVALTGEGSTDGCPTASATVSTADQDPTQSLTVNVGNPVELSGADSHHPDGGTIEDYEWSVVDQPTMQTISNQLDPDETTTVTPYSVGHYQFELMVYDQDGIPSCDPAVVELNVIDDASDIRVELSWTARSGDKGADLDLHYLNSNGSVWGEPSCDYCIFYGRTGQEDDDPFDDGSEVYLNIDSLTGDDPEVLIHNDPAAGPTYSAGVYYFADPVDVGANDAQVRIFTNGVLALEKTEVLEEPGQGHHDEGDFWHVADIEVESSGGIDVVPVDQLFDNAGLP